MTDLNFSSVQIIEIDAEREGQRVDNYLIGLLKGVPKSMIYRLLRKGEVRVNKKRTKPDYKLKSQDLLRLPPIRVSEPSSKPIVNTQRAQDLEKHILFEDSHLLILNKPSGVAVHGGSGLSYGVIEALRSIRPEAKFLELVHRLDRDTSGCLMIAKRRSALTNLHEQIRNKTVDKRYYALVSGVWAKSQKSVNVPLLKNTLRSGERVVKVSDEGKASETRFFIQRRYEGATLIEAVPITGRTHQIRVHCQYAGHCIAGDSKYYDKPFEEMVQSKGLKRLFLHAHQLSFDDPRTGERLRFNAPMDAHLEKTLKQFTPIN